MSNNIDNIDDIDDNFGKGIYSRHTCSHCGKVFHSDMHYKYKRRLSHNGNTRYFCSRECMDNHTEYIGDKTDAYKTTVLDKDKPRLRELFFDKGWNIEEIGNEMGYTYKTVSAFIHHCIDSYPGGF